MSIDYVVRFDETMPTEREVIFVIHGFLGSARRAWVGKYGVRLRGSPSYALQLVGPDRQGESHSHHREFSFFVEKEVVTFTLRGQDEYVHALVEGICKVLARRWHGKVESM